MQQVGARSTFGVHLTQGGRAMPCCARLPVLRQVQNTAGLGKRLAMASVKIKYRARNAPGG